MKTYLVEYLINLDEKPNRELHLNDIKKYFKFEIGEEEDINSVADLYLERININPQYSFEIYKIYEVSKNKLTDNFKKIEVRDSIDLEEKLKKYRITSF